MSDRRSAFRVGVVLVALAVVAAAIVSVTHAQDPGVTVSVDAAANRHPISPQVYGLAYADPAALSDLNCAIERYGGNNTSRYNWQLNADNRGSDWYFESIAEPDATPAGRIDSIIAANRGAGADSMITIPTIAWVARVGLGRGKLSSFSIAKYGAQTGNDWQWFPDAGNGVHTGGQNVTGNDPADANVQADSSFHYGLVQHIVGKWGQASAAGLRYYILDNEPSIWFATHRDVHPNGPSMDEIKAKIIDYATMIKSIDPTALVVAPEEWGWSGYLLSGMDQQYGSLHGWNNLPDRTAHGGMDYLPWLLDLLHQNEQSSGKRLLDVFSVHYYPQGGESGNDTSTNMQLLRNRSTRSLWDVNYVDQSWINDRVQLIPRLKSWVAAHYPGTSTAITEYNWGAEGHINGATTQADILGIFGREGIDMATRWTTPDPSTPTYKAIKMYRNYDGNKSGFGDTSVLDTVPNPDSLSSFAAVRSSDGAVTVVLINKVLSGSTPVTINLSNFYAASSAHAWQLTSSNAIAQLPDVRVAGGALTLTVPAQSVTLLVLPSSGPSADFSLSFDQSAVIVSPGEKVKSQLRINRAGGFAGPVTVSPPTIIPDGIRVILAEPATAGDNVAMKIKVKGSTLPGIYPLEFTGSDDSGRMRSATLTLMVQ